MLKTLFCLSAVAFLATSGAYAEDAQNDAQDQSTEQSLAGCGCGKTSKKGNDGSEGGKGNEGDKGNKDIVAQCDAEEGHSDEDHVAPVQLSCRGCD